MSYPAVYILDKKIKKDTFRRTKCLSHAGHVFGSPLVIAIAKLLHEYYLISSNRFLYQQGFANEKLRLAFVHIHSLWAAEIHITNTENNI